MFAVDVVLRYSSLFLLFFRQRELNGRQDVQEFTVSNFGGAGFLKICQKQRSRFSYHKQGNLCHLLA